MISLQQYQQYMLCRFYTFDLHCIMRMRRLCVLKICSIQTFEQKLNRQYKISLRNNKRIAYGMYETTNVNEILKFKIKLNLNENQ